MRSLLPVACLATVLSLSASPGWASQRQSFPEADCSRLCSLWGFVAEHIAFFAKSSGTMDPDGKPLPPPSAGSTAGDSSGTMDPDGKP
jgi:hypothetical protein